MIYLNTETNELTIPKMRKLVGKTIQWAKKNIKTKEKKCSPTFKISKKINGFGEYNLKENQMILNPIVCKNVKMLVRTALHEYCHSLQDLKNYNTTLNIVGYRKHPQEIEARNMEKLYSNCWKEIKNNL